MATRKKAKRKKSRRKKAKKPQPDADGYLHTGIYTQYVGPAESEPMAEGVGPPDWALDKFVDWLKDLETKFRDVIRGHLEPVGSTDSSECPQEAVFYPYDLGEGQGDQRVSVDRDCTYRFDVFQYFGELQRLWPALERDDAGAAMMVGYRLGRLHERMHVRGFEHAADVGLRSIDKMPGVQEGRRAKAAAARAKKHEIASEQLAKTKYKFPQLSDQKVLMEKKAAESLTHVLGRDYPNGVPLSTFREWLKPLE